MAVNGKKQIKLTHTITIGMNYQRNKNGKENGTPWNNDDLYSWHFTHKNKWLQGKIIANEKERWEQNMKIKVITYGCFSLSVLAWSDFFWKLVSLPPPPPVVDVFFLLVWLRPPPLDLVCVLIAMYTVFTSSWQLGNLNGGGERTAHTKKKTDEKKKIVLGNGICQCLLRWVWLYSAEIVVKSRMLLLVKFT